MKDIPRNFFQYFISIFLSLKKYRRYLFVPHLVAIGKVLALISVPVHAASLTGPATSDTGTYIVEWMCDGNYPNQDICRLYERIGTNGVWNQVSSSRPGGWQFNPTRPIGIYQYYLEQCGPSQRYNTCVKYPTTLTVVVTPSVPTINLASGDTDGVYPVSWSASSGATLYRWQERLNSGSWSNEATTTSTSITRSGRSNGTWGYRVRACLSSDITHCSAHSGIKTISVGNVPPAPTSLVVPSSSTTGSYTVNWNSVAGATTYTLQEKAGSGAWITIQNSSSTSRSFNGKTSNNYSYRVSACNSVGCSTYVAAKTIAVTLSVNLVYTYDALGRLTRVDENGAIKNSYCYDAAGNRTVVSAGSSVNCP